MMIARSSLYFRCDACHDGGRAGFFVAQGSSMSELKDLSQKLISRKIKVLRTYRTNNPMAMVDSKNGIVTILGQGKTRHFRKHFRQKEVYTPTPLS